MKTILLLLFAATLCSHRVAPSSLAAEPRTSATEQALIKGRWNVQTELGQRAWGNIIFREGHEFTTMNGPEGAWKVTGERTVELGGKYLLQFAPGLGSFVVTERNGTMVANGTLQTAVPATAPIIETPTKVTRTVPDPLGLTPPRTVPDQPLKISLPPEDLPPPVKTAATPVPVKTQAETVPAKRNVNPASAQQSISSWRAIVLDKPFHAGDSHSREMAHVKPQGREYNGAFELPKEIVPGVATILYVNLNIAGVLPMNSKQLAHARKQPSGATRLVINGQDVAFLNEFSKEGANSKSQKMSVRIKGTVLRPGRNEIKVVPGRGGQLDDIEIHSLTVSSRAE